VDRFYRQILLPEIGLTNQIAIQKSNVAVIGIGGLGCPVALYLAAAGIKNLVLIDPDSVSLDNLNRQILFGIDDIGKNKATTAAHKLMVQFGDIVVEGLDAQLTHDNALELLDKVDLILDCSDNFSCRYASTNAAEILQKTVLTGSLYRNEGQIMCFDSRKENYKSFRSLFPDEITQLNANNCEEAGVLGAMAGVIGNLLSLEAVHQLICKPGKLENEMIVYNQNTYTVLRIKF